jgi:hypothetical protein
MFNDLRNDIIPLSSALLCIFKHVQQKSSTPFGPLTLCPAPLFDRDTLPIVMPEWYTLLLQNDIFQVFAGFLVMHILDA